MNYLGHWLLMRQLLAGQQKLRSNHQHQNSIDSSSRSGELTSVTAGSQNNAKHISQERLSKPDDIQHAQHGGTRVLLLTSMTHKAGRIQFDDLAANKSYTGFRRYADSKLAELLAVRLFAQQMNR